ncbi:MAG: tRNA(Met) cytidine acetate ligase [Bacillota bacterium]
MKTLGITAEYNPFHNGHAYHIAKARELTGADCVLAVMSGDFTQRGEPAVSSKWERAKAAVSASEDRADIIIELPYAFACSRASVFAPGAVDMLVNMGADCISFGCEAEDPEQIRKLAETLVSENGAISEARKEFMKEGLSGAKAYELAVSRVAGEEAGGLLLEPNNILALEYMKRILHHRAEGVAVEDLPVTRYGSGYGSVSAEGEDFAGGGALRKMIREGADVSRYLPGGGVFEDTAALSEKYLQLLKGTVLRSTPEDIGRICGVGEGLENSIMREIKTASDGEALVSALTSKRYTGATIRRALTNILVGLSWKEADLLTSRAPSAGRLLAAAEAGRRFMRERRDGGFTIITNVNREEEGLAPLDRRLLKLDETAADIYNLLCAKDIYSASDRVTSPYIE